MLLFHKLAEIHKILSIFNAPELKPCCPADHLFVSSPEPKAHW